MIDNPKDDENDYLARRELEHHHHMDEEIDEHVGALGATISEGAHHTPEKSLQDEHQDDVEANESPEHEQEDEEMEEDLQDEV